MASSNHVIASALAVEAAKITPGMVQLLGGINAFNIIAFQKLSKDEEEKRDNNNDVAVALEYLVLLLDY
jgi:hypothetical protein